MPGKGKEKKNYWQRQCARVRKRRKKKNWQRQRVSVHEYFCPLSSLIFSLQFFLYFGRKLFGGFEEKTLKFYHLFSFFSTQLNTLQKSFSSSFLFKVFLYPISPPNKHTLKVQTYLEEIFFNLLHENS